MFASALLLAFAPAAAHAARDPASVTVTNCKDDHLTVVGALKLSGSAARKARGANLQMQFQAMPLFGLPRTGPFRNLGKKTKASGDETFSGLPADGWAGVVRWRYKKGSKTVLSGLERSEPVKVGGVRGAAICTLAEGFKPPDTTPPQLFINPDDAVWHRGPAQVQLLAKDDYTGVQGVRYSLDGGPITEIRNGGTFTIATEGAHSVAFAGNDVAGNTASRTAVVRVDTNAPSKPVMRRPFSVTSSTAPAFQWSASTDSASGLKGYFLTIKRASDGSLVSFTPHDANTTSVPSPVQLADGETYTASVVAVDNTDTPFTSESDPFTFRVDSHPEITGSSPGNGSVVSGNGKDANLSLTLDRPADPSTVSSSTVVLSRNSESGSTPSYNVTCGSPCSTINIDPSGTLGEGRYTLSLNGVKSEEGVGVPGSVKFSVAFREDPSGGSVSTVACGIENTSTDASPPASLLNASAPETGTVKFDYSVAGNTSGSGLRVVENGSTIQDTGALTGSATGATLSFPISNGKTYTVQYYAKCSSSSATFTASNVVMSRDP